MRLLCETCEQLPLGTRVKILASLRKDMIPRGKPGPKKPRIDKAYVDYKAGSRGLKLFRAYIPGHNRMSRWRRRVEENRLIKTLQKRSERERKRQHGAPKQHVR